MCGAVRYECRAAPVVSGFCHCRRCQQLSGTAFAAVMAVPTDALKITGKVTYYESPADSGATVRNGFCPTCGSRLFGKSSNMPALIAIMVGSLDKPQEFRPGMHVFTEGAQPWDKIGGELPAFATMPTPAEMAAR